jgi:hypothetical protein
MNCSEKIGWELVDKFGNREWEKIKNMKFPYPKISDNSCKKEWLTLNSKQLSIKNPSNIIRKFHKSIHKASRIKHLSNYEYWNLLKEDFELFRKFYFNRLTRSDWFKSPNNSKYLKEGYVPDFIYYCGLTTSGKAPLPSYFKPMLAKYIITKYLKKYETIFDPFSGYSGRMLGTLACGKKYIGQDINEVTIKESKNVLDFVNNNLTTFDSNVSCKLHVKDTLKSSGSYESLFTCSPYGLLETWNQPIKDYTCDEWISLCLKNFKCEKYVFVTDDKIKKYKNNVVEELANTSHWGKNKEYIVIIKL